MDAPGVCRGWQQLGHLVGRSIRWTDPDSHRNADCHPVTNSNAYADCIAVAHTHCITDPHSNTDAYAHANTHANTRADCDAVTHTDSVARTDSVAYTDPVAHADAGTNRDAHSYVDDPRNHASRGQSRSLLSRLAGAERRYAALSGLCQCRRAAARTRAQHLQWFNQRDAGRRGPLDVYGLRHRPRLRIGERRVSDIDHSLTIHSTDKSSKNFYEM